MTRPNVYSVTAAVSAVASEKRMPVVTSQVARFFQRHSVATA